MLEADGKRMRQKGYEVVYGERGYMLLLEQGCSHGLVGVQCVLGPCIGLAQESAFFFEKKNQKTFASLGRASQENPEPN